jgi:hypothetical protein
MNEMQNRPENENAVSKKAWTKPEAKSEKVKDITAGASTTGFDAGCAS